MVQEDTLLHGEALLVIATGNLEHVSLELFTERISLNLLRDALVVKDTDFALIEDFNQLLAPSGRIRNVQLHHTTQRQLAPILRHVCRERKLVQGDGWKRGTWMEEGRETGPWTYLHGSLLQGTTPVECRGYIVRPSHIGSTRTPGHVAFFVPGRFSGGSARLAAGHQAIVRSRTRLMRLSHADAAGMTSMNGNWPTTLITATKAKFGTNRECHLVAMRMTPRVIHGRFGAGCERRVVEWIRGNVATECRIMDLGCGNGHFSLRLLERGFMRIGALDYSERAVQLAQTLLSAFGDRVAVFQADILDWQSVPAAHRGGYDVVVDKGTFDAISLRPDTNDLSSDATGRTGALAAAVKRTLRVLLADAGRRLFVITSCNWTADELERIFSPECRPVASVPHATFVFGGKTGQDVSTVIFQLDR